MSCGSRPVSSLVRGGVLAAVAARVGSLQRVSAAAVRVACVEVGRGRAAMSSPVAGPSAHAASTRALRFHRSPSLRCCGLRCASPWTRPSQLLLAGCEAVGGGATLTPLCSPAAEDAGDGVEGWLLRCWVLAPTVADTFALRRLEGRPARACTTGQLTRPLPAAPATLRQTWRAKREGRTEGRKEGGKEEGRDAGRPTLDKASGWPGAWRSHCDGE